jgi:hypothetical protein
VPVVPVVPLEPVVPELELELELDVPDVLVLDESVPEEPALVVPALELDELELDELDELEDEDELALEDELELDPVVEPAPELDAVALEPVEPVEAVDPPVELALEALAVDVGPPVEPDADAVVEPAVLLDAVVVVPELPVAPVEVEPVVGAVPDPEQFKLSAAATRAPASDWCRKVMSFLDGVAPRPGACCPQTPPEPGGAARPASARRSGAAVGALGPGAAGACLAEALHGRAGLAEQGRRAAHARPVRVGLGQVCAVDAARLAPAGADVPHGDGRAVCVGRALLVVVRGLDVRAAARQHHRE